MLMTESYMIIEEKRKSNNSFLYEVISLNEFNKTPLRTVYSIDPFALGIIVNEDLTEYIKYHNHKYELATILGEDRTNHALLVYGPKIGKKIISTKNDTFYNFTFYNEGNLLLLKQREHINDFFIIHNITQARLKATMDGFVQKAK